MVVDVTSSCTLKVARSELGPLEVQAHAVLGPAASQGDAFAAVCDVVRGVLSGQNGSIIAYGQTGSGKTYTITGGDSLDADVSKHAVEGSERGLIPRSLELLFDHIRNDRSGASWHAYVSFVEIYNERVFDLLAQQKPRQSIAEAFGPRAGGGRAGRDSTPSRRSPSDSLEMLEARGGGAVSVPGLTLVQVRDLQQALQVLCVGTSSRTSGDNGVNVVSSRSHAIFQVTVERKATAGGNRRVQSAKLNLVDLAGSEKLRPSSSLSGAALQELAGINLSLSALGHCIASLVDSKRSHIPYRDSKLTRFLQDSLNGRSLTAMCVCISPSQSQLDETLSSLKFADRAKRALLTRVPSEPPQPSPEGRRVHELLANVKMLTDELQAERTARTKLERSLQNAEAQWLSGTRETSWDKEPWAPDASQPPKAHALANQVSGEIASCLQRLEKQNAELKSRLEALEVAASNRTPRSAALQPAQPLNMAQPNLNKVLLRLQSAIAVETCSLSAWQELHAAAVEVLTQAGLPAVPTPVPSEPEVCWPSREASELTQKEPGVQVEGSRRGSLPSSSALLAGGLGDSIVEETSTVSRGAPDPGGAIAATGAEGSLLTSGSSMSSPRRPIYRSSLPPESSAGEQRRPRSLSTSRPSRSAALPSRPRSANPRAASRVQNRPAAPPPSPVSVREEPLPVIAPVLQELRESSEGHLPGDQLCGRQDLLRRGREDRAWRRQQRKLGAGSPAESDSSVGPAFEWALEALQWSPRTKSHTFSGASLLSPREL